MFPGCGSAWNSPSSTTWYTRKSSTTRATSARPPGTWSNAGPASLNVVPTMRCITSTACPESAVSTAGMRIRSDLRYAADSATARMFAASIR